jgi:WD40 repeat protein
MAEDEVLTDDGGMVSSSRQDHSEYADQGSHRTQRFPSSAPSTDPKYDAFISYSHAGNRSLAPALQRGLEVLAKPLYQRRALRVFRDQTSLAATPALWEAIEEALGASRFFIVVASPAAAQSQWVRQEVAWWIKHRDPDRILIVLVDGVITWDKASNDFSAELTDALPDSLFGLFRQEPLWVDLRWVKEASEISHRNPRIQDAVATLAAPLRGLSKDDLVGRDLVLHRRTLRLTQFAVTLTTVLALAAASGAVVAVRQRDAADLQRRLAESRALASAAQSLTSSRLDSAWLLARQAVRLDSSAQTRAALFAAMTASPQLVRFIHQADRPSALAMMPAGGMAVAHEKGGITLLDASYAHERSLSGTGDSPVTALAVSRVADVLVGADQKGSVRLWSRMTGAFRWHRGTGLGEALAAAVSPGGRNIAIATKNNELVLLDGATGDVLRTASITFPGSVEHLTFLNENSLLVGDYSGYAEVRNVSRNLRMESEHIQEAPGDGGFIDGWSEDGQNYAFAKNSFATVFDASGRIRGHFTAVPPATKSMAVSDRGNRIAVLYAQSIFVMDNSPAAAAAGQKVIQLPGFARVEMLEFSPDGRWLLAAGSDAMAVFDLQQRGRLATELPARLGPLECEACVTDLAADPQGRSVVWTDGARVECRRLDSPTEGSAVNDDSGPPTGIAFTTDGARLVVATWNGLDVRPAPRGCPTPEPVTHIETAGSDYLLPVSATTMVAWSYTGLPHLIDLRAGRILRTYGTQAIPAGDVGDVSVSSDSRTAAYTLTNGDIRWFDIDTGASEGVVHTGTGTSGALTFLPGARTVARTTATSIQLWEPQAGLVGQFDGSAQQLRFTADGKILVGLDDDEMLHVWDVPSRTMLGTVQVLPLVTDQGDMTAGGAEHALRTGMALSAGGILWVAAPSTRPTGWNLSFATWNREACGWAGRSLSSDEWRQYAGTNPPKDLSCGR